MSKQDFQRPLDSTRYRWLPQLIILMNLVAVAAAVFLLRSVEQRLVFTAGEELRIAAAEVSDKLDRLLFERYGDAQMMARAFSLRPFDPDYISSYLGSMRTNYRPVYLWLGAGRITARARGFNVPSKRRRSSSTTRRFTNRRTGTRPSRSQPPLWMRPAHFSAW